MEHTEPFNLLFNFDSGLNKGSMAEGEGFEPPEPFGSTVFKTAAFDRSATPPRAHSDSTTSAAATGLGLSRAARKLSRLASTKAVPVTARAR